MTYAYVKYFGGKQDLDFCPGSGHRKTDTPARSDHGRWAGAAGRSPQPGDFVRRRSRQQQGVSFGIDPSSGALTELGQVGLQEGPCMISTDRKGHFLLGAHFGAGAVSVNPLDESGVAVDPQVQWEETAQYAHYVETDATNRFVFVPHIMPSNAIFQFTFDEESGRLTPNKIPKVDRPEGEGPRHYCYHPSKDLVYAANENGNTVTAYTLDTSAGTLTAFQTISTLPPEGFDGDSYAAQIKITPDGRFLYAPNRGPESVACFRVEEDGTLSTFGYQPIEAHTRGTSLDPEGRFYYAAGASSGRLASFSISEQTGVLEPLENFAVGESPMWIQFVRPG